MSVLIADSDVRARGQLKELLLDAGFPVDETEGDAAALMQPHRRRCQLVLLATPPRTIGSDPLVAFRQRDFSTPVIVLASYDSIEARLRAFANGADDYLAKPFNPDELVARMRAVLRRTSSHGTHALRCGDLTLDLIHRKATRAGREVKLTGREFALLQFLMEHKGQAQTRETLLDRVWQREFDLSSNVVEVYVRHLRRKVDPPHQRPLIRTVRGVGYVMTDVT
jgi:two-component system copper resistance phosphate regulon response regulator CusR